MNKVIIYGIIFSNIWLISHSSDTKKGKTKTKEKLTEIKRDENGHQVGYLYSMYGLHLIERPDIYEILTPPGAFDYKFTSEEDKKNLKNKWSEPNWLTWKMLKKESKVVTKYRVSTFVKACKGMRKVAKAARMESGTAMRTRIMKLIKESDSSSDERAAFDCFIKVEQVIPTKLCGYSPINKGLLFMVLLKDNEFGIHHPMDMIYLRADISRLGEPEIIINDENSMGYFKSMKVFDINKRLDISIWIQPLAFEYKFTNEKNKQMLIELWNKDGWFEWRNLHVKHNLKTQRIQNIADACESMRSSLNALQQETNWSIQNRVIRSIKYDEHHGFSRAIVDCSLQFENRNEIPTKLAGYPARTVFDEDGDLRYYREFFMVLLEHHEFENAYMPMDVLHFDENSYDGWSRGSTSKTPHGKTKQKYSQKPTEIYYEVEERTYYEILGVPVNATEDVIKKAYRTQAKLKHPDKKRNDPRATKEFQELLKAYTTLMDPNERYEYDRNLI